MIGDHYQPPSWKQNLSGRFKKICKRSHLIIHFDAKGLKDLCEIPWVFNNRSRDYDYRAQGPVVRADSKGNPLEIRLTTWLRAPLKAPLEVQRAAYQSIRVFTEYAQNPKYQLIVNYRPGDLLAFDNRRLLHGRRAYDSNQGRRYIEGIYADRDELYSRIRVLRRQLAKQHD